MTTDLISWKAMSKPQHRCPLLNAEGLCSIQPKMLVATREWFERYCFGEYENCLVWRCHTACIDLRRALSREGGAQIARRPEFDVEMPVKMISTE